MYIRLFILIFNFITQPEKTWKECNEEQDTDNENFFRSYLYPILGIIALFSFIGILFYLKKWDVQIAIKQVIKETIPYFAGYFITVYALPYLSLKLFEIKLTNPICERFTGYASAALYATAMLYVLFPFFPLIQILTVYTFNIVRQGANHYLQIKEDYLIKFTIFASVLIILVPLIVRWLLIMTMQGLNN